MRMGPGGLGGSSVPSSRVTLRPPSRSAAGPGGLAAAEVERALHLALGLRRPGLQGAELSLLLGLALLLPLCWRKLSLTRALRCAVPWDPLPGEWVAGAGPVGAAPSLLGAFSLSLPH